MMILFGALAVAATNDDKAEGHRWWDDVKFLASDDLQGRMTGSAGYQSAAGYVAERFKKEGLTAAGTVGYFQPVEFESHQIDEARTTIEIVQGDKTTDLRLGKEAFLRPAGDTANQIDAGMVFVGYGMSVPEANYDDLAGMDLHGKIAVYLSGGPSTIKDPLRAHEESLGERWKALKAAGAVGIAVVLNPSEQEIPWERIAGNRQRPSLELAEVALRRDQGMQIEMTINPNDADEFFAGSGHTMAEIVAAAKAKKPLPHFAMTATIHGQGDIGVAECRGSDRRFGSGTEKRICDRERASGPFGRGRGGEWRRCLQRRDGQRIGRGGADSDCARFSRVGHEAEAVGDVPGGVRGGGRRAWIVVFRESSVGAGKKHCCGCKYGYVYAALPIEIFAGAGAGRVNVGR